jgi:hypothetical protein
MSPTNYKILGQTEASLQGVETLHYKTPTSASTLIRGLNITNASFQDDQYTISINPLNVFVATVSAASGHATNYSYDGITWFQGNSLNTTAGNVDGATAYGDGKFIRTNYAGLVSISTNGVTWTTPTSAPSFANVMYYGNNRFVMHSGSSGSNQIAYSLNGSTWTYATAPIAGSLAYGNGKFFLLNTTAVYTSTDAVTWTNSNTTNPPQYRLYGAPPIPSSFGYTFGNPNNAIFYGGGKFIGFASDQPAFYSSTGATFSNIVSYSSDGINWTSVANMPSSSLWGQASYGNGIFVAVGRNSSGQTIYAYSGDGINWTAGPGTPSYAHTNGSQVAFGNGKFVAIGGNGATSYSTDGINWTAGSGGNFSSYSSWMVNFSTTSNSNYILYNNTIPAYTTISLKCGYALQSSSSPASIQVTSKKGITTFTSFGAEIT